MTETAENLTFLIDAGFSESAAKKALETNNNNVAEAMEWLLIHGESLKASETSQTGGGTTLKLSTPTATDEVEKTSDATTDDASSASANSLKCEDCGILLKDEDVATLHAHKTGHINFSESTESIKPKTKEEIEEQKKRLQEKLAKIRAEKAEKERLDFIEQEKARRRQGREINEIKQKHHENELKRIAEEKRAEKKADAAYKQNLLNQIAADRDAKKKARELEQSGGASKDTQSSAVSAPVAAAAAASSSSTEPVAKKDYAECKIQVRQTDGKSMVHVFKANEQLAAVRLWVEMNRTDCSDGSKFQLMQTFPKKVYTDDDMSKNLTELGLTPASSLVITKI